VLWEFILYPDQIKQETFAGGNNLRTESVLTERATRPSPFQYLRLGFRRVLQTFHITVTLGLACGCNHL